MDVVGFGKLVNELSRFVLSIFVTISLIVWGLMRARPLSTITVLARRNSSGDLVLDSYSTLFVAAIFFVVITGIPYGTWTWDALKVSIVRTTPSNPTRLIQLLFSVAAFEYICITAVGSRVKPRSRRLFRRVIFRYAVSFSIIFAVLYWLILLLGVHIANMLVSNLGISHWYIFTNTYSAGVAGWFKHSSAGQLTYELYQTFVGAFTLTLVLTPLTFGAYLCKKISPSWSNGNAISFFLVLSTASLVPWLVTKAFPDLGYISADSEYCISIGDGSYRLIAEFQNNTTDSYYMNTSELYAQVDDLKPKTWSGEPMTGVAPWSLALAYPLHNESLGTDVKPLILKPNARALYSGTFTPNVYHTPMPKYARCRLVESLNYSTDLLWYKIPNKNFVFQPTQPPALRDN